MKTFKTFLNESKGLENEATLVFHKIVSMLDHGHVDYTEEKIKINVGALIKKSGYNKVILLIRKGTNTKARLGTHRQDGSAHIVIETAKIPARDKIDSFLEKTHVAKSFIAAFGKYLLDLHVSDDETPKHADEIESEVNTPEKTEELYNQIVQKIDAAVEKYNKTNDSAADVFSKFNIAKQETRNITLGMVKSDHFGSSDDEFAKKYMNEVPETKHLSKENKDKILSRLKSLYVSKIQPLLK